MGTKGDLGPYFKENYMGCGCGNKRNKGVAGAPAATTPRMRPVVKRQVARSSTPTSRLMPTKTSVRPFNPLRYYVTYPDGNVESFNTLAEAQTILRRTPGAKIESRREIP